MKSATLVIVIGALLCVPATGRAVEQCEKGKVYFLGQCQTKKAFKAARKAHAKKTQPKLRKAAAKAFEGAKAAYEKAGAKPGSAEAEALAVAHDAVVELEFQRLRGMTAAFRGDEQALQRAIAEMLDLLQKLRGEYTTIISYGVLANTLCAHKRVGDLYLELASAVANTPAPKRVAKLPEAAEEYATLMLEKGEAIEQKALQAYKALVKLADKEKAGDNQCVREAKKRLPAPPPAKK